MLTFVTPAYAQEHGPAEAAAGEAHAGAEAGGHGVFPPFDPATFGSQLLWLVICFGALYLLMSRLALPQIGGILEARDKRIAADLGEAGKLKQETDAAAAAYEQALAEARRNAHAIAQSARDSAKAEQEENRRRLEGDLQGRLDAAEARIGEVKSRALAEVDTIARDTTAAIVESLLGAGADGAEVGRAVNAAMAEGRSP